MRQKIVLCLLVVFILSITIVPNLYDKAAFRSPLQSIEIHNDANLIAYIPNSRIILNDLLKLGANVILYPSTIKLQINLFSFKDKNRVILFILCRFILLFFIFYQSARTNSRQDGPVLINGLTYQH